MTSTWARTGCMENLRSVFLMPATDWRSELSLPMPRDAPACSACCAALDRSFVMRRGRRCQSKGSPIGSSPSCRHTQKVRGRGTRYIAAFAQADSESIAMSSSQCFYPSLTDCRCWFSLSPCSPCGKIAAIRATSTVSPTLLAG